MIKSIHLRNFQGHKATDLELGTGVNVISGASDVGKSTIIRALRWLILNRPSGAGERWRYHKADLKDEVSISLELDNGFVKRFREGSSNGYEVDGTTLVAIRQDVPSEVSDLLDLDDHNVQTQHSPYFLVADSAGDVARKLNEVCGLDIIDECLRNAGLLASRNTQGVSECKQRTAELEMLRERYLDLDNREQALQELEKFDSERIRVGSIVLRLDAVLAQMTNTQSKLDDLGDFLEIEESAEALFAHVDELEQLHARTESLTTVLDSIATLEDQIIAAGKRVEEAEQQFHKALQDEGVCPLCEQVIGE